MPYYSGDCNYAGGDYYGAGDYYRGDPGLFSSIGKAIKGLAKTALGVIPGGTLAGKAIELFKPGGIARKLTQAGSQIVTPFAPAPFGPAESIPMVSGPVGTMLPGGFVQMCGIKGTRPNKSSYYRRIPGTLQGQLIPKGSVCVKTRRMNVANARAIRRSVRRLSGFAKLARRTLRFVQAKPVKGKAVFKKKR